MSLRALANAVGLRRADASKAHQGGDHLRSPFEITPEDFLERAEEDFGSGTASAEINALTNAKRAIQCQVDSVLAALGCEIVTAKSKQSKLVFLADAGFIAPRILRRVMDARNILEHEYKAPTTAQVAEALDLAALFVLGTTRYMQTFQSDFSIGNEAERNDKRSFMRQLEFSFNTCKKLFIVRAYENVYPDYIIGELFYAGANSSGIVPRILGEMTVPPEDPAFVVLVRLVNAGDRRSKIKSALTRLFDLIEPLRDRA